MKRPGMILTAVTLTALVLAGGAWAEAPKDSLRPMARVVAAALVTPPVPLSTTLRPALRPKSIVREAMARKRKRAKGAVCGDPDLQGVAVGAVPGRINGCGIESAVRLRAVAGVTLSQEAVVDCTTAKALKKWTEKSAKPAMAKVGGLARLRVAAHYACRTRNNQPGAKISEHGRGRAIDISGFTLRNGETVSVLEGWNSRRYGSALKKMHAGACGPFGTVLGPNADRFHRDHFHFDTARYRSGSYCR